MSHLTEVQVKFDIEVSCNTLMRHTSGTHDVVAVITKYLRSEPRLMKGGGKFDGIVKFGNFEKHFSRALRNVNVHVAEC